MYSLYFVLLCQAVSGESLQMFIHLQNAPPRDLDPVSRFEIFTYQIPIFSSVPAENKGPLNYFKRTGYRPSNFCSFSSEPIMMNRRCERLPNNFQLFKGIHDLSFFKRAR
jgi:hypothetical protein